MGEGEYVIICRVNAIRSSHDPYGNEYVCVELAAEAQRPPTLIQMPKDAPQELSFVLPILSQIPKMLPQPKVYVNRLVAFFTIQEWERLKDKYRYGDEVEVKIGRDGSISVKPIG